MKNTFWQAMVCSLIFGSVISLQAGTFDVDGNVLGYTISGTEAIVSFPGGTYCGKINIPSEIEGFPVAEVNVYGLRHGNTENLEGIVFPETMRKVTNQGPFSWGDDSVHFAVFKGSFPEIGTGASSGTRFLRALDHLYYPRRHAMEWRENMGSMIYGLDKPWFAGYSEEYDPIHVEIVSSRMRGTDPTIMDTVYKVVSTNRFVNVRALAFQDGKRSFAKVLRPMTFVDGTETNLGNHVSANVEHTISWRVSADWNIPLADVKFDVLVKRENDDLLYMELMDVPAVSGHDGMTVSWTPVSACRLLDALFWLYADGDEGLSLENGTLRHGTTVLYSNGELTYSDYYTGVIDRVVVYPAYAYILSKMGYSVLDGADLTHVNELLRLDLVSGLYAKKPLPPQQ